MKELRATLIGVFVLGAMALTVAAILFLGSGRLFKERLTVVSYFPGSVAGLRVGAPVTYRGVRVGDVKSVGIVLAPDMTPSVVEVSMELVPEVVKVSGTRAGSIATIVPRLLERGLSARLVMQSFVTGQLQVELDLRPGVQAAQSGVASEVPEIPTVPSPFQALAEQLQNLDVAAAVASFQRALGSVEELLASPAVKAAVSELPAVIADVRRAVGAAEREVRAFSATGQHGMNESSAAFQKSLASIQMLAETLDREAAGTLAQARGTLANANTAIEGANVLLDPHGATVMHVQEAAEDLAATAARLREISERVDRDPTILIRGRRR